MLEPFRLKQRKSETGEKSELKFMVCYHVMNNNVAKGLLLWKNHVLEKGENDKSRYRVKQEIELKK